ncbi:MAG: AraC family transcriptional regulator [Oscillospiraceae bacterium]|nr:AraC family transcriptional regulator [Oscillospiraceae bacterium]
MDEIAKNSGLYDKSRLTSAFSEYFGTTPSEHRKLNRGSRLLEDLESRDLRALNDDIIEYYKLQNIHS